MLLKRTLQSKNAAGSELPRGTDCLYGRCSTVLALQCMTVIGQDTLRRLRGVRRGCRSPSSLDGGDCGTIGPTRSVPLFDSKLLMRSIFTPFEMLRSCFEGCGICRTGLYKIIILMIAYDLPRMRSEY